MGRRSDENMRYEDVHTDGYSDRITMGMGRVTRGGKGEAGVRGEGRERGPSYRPDDNSSGWMSISAYLYDEKAVVGNMKLACILFIEEWEGSSSRVERN